jgi:hypothetical protein
VKSKARCPHCQVVLHRVAPRCTACDGELVTAADLDTIGHRCIALANELADEPYLRSSGLLSYTLRSRVRGFLEDLSHPLSRRLLSHLHGLCRLAPALAPEPLLAHCEREWITARQPVLARALRLFRRRFRGELARAEQEPDFDRWYDALRAGHSM